MSLQFINESDFSLVERWWYKLNSTAVHWQYGKSNGFIPLGYERDGVKVWDILQAKIAAGEITVEAVSDEALTQAETDAFKASRASFLSNATVTLTGLGGSELIFDADETSISRLGNAVMAAEVLGLDDDHVLQWSLANTETGVMTDVYLADLKSAYVMAVQNMAAIWGR